MIAQNVTGFSGLRKAYRGNPSFPPGQNCFRIIVSCEDQVVNDAGDWVTREGSLNDRFMQVDITNQLFVNSATGVLCQETDSGATPAFDYVWGMTPAKCGGTADTSIPFMMAVLVETFLIGNGFIEGGTSVLA